jgi:hypothetical protein
MLTQDVVRDHFEAVAEAAGEAAKLATDLGIDELSDFLTAWAGSTSRQADEIVAHYRTAADRATRLFFGSMMGRAGG